MPNSIVILDKISIHHVSRVAWCTSTLSTTLSSDLNPVEECYSKVKSLLKNMETTFHDDLEPHILAALSCINTDDCNSM
jgi:hypothetical protein